jgi:hypothetical protein
MKIINYFIQIIKIIVLIFLLSNCRKETNIPESQFPVIITDSVSRITRTTAQCGGRIISIGGSEVTSTGVCWSFNKAPTINNYKTVDSLELNTFMSVMSGLNPDSIYFVRAYASNSFGIGYGNEIMFRCLVRYNKKTYIKAYLDLDNRIYSYEYLDSLKNVINTTHISYLNNSIFEKSNDTMIRKYNLNLDGFIDYLIDSTISKIDTLFIFNYYENGYIKSMSLFYINPNFGFEYSYNENYSYYYISSAYVSVSLCDSSNMIDFIINPSQYSMNLINCGKQNHKLVKHVRWGANGGPSTYASESDYKYKLDNNGLVIEKVETYFPSHYYTTKLQENDLGYYITYYEYIK